MRGQSTINKVVGRITKLVNNLEKGIKECYEEILDREGKITSLKSDIEELYQAKLKADKLRNNLNKLLGE